MSSRHPAMQVLAAFIAIVIAAALMVANPATSFAAGCVADQGTEFANEGDLQNILNDPSSVGCTTGQTLTVNFSAGAFSLSAPLVWGNSSQVDFVGASDLTRTTFSGGDAFNPIQGNDGTVSLKYIDISDGLNDNTGSFNGGTISAKNVILDHVSIVDSQVTESSARGGCIFAVGNVSLTDVVLNNCAANADGGSVGGCIYTDGDLNAVDTLLQNCSASGEGSIAGAVYASGSVTMSSTDPQTLVTEINSGLARGHGGCIVATGPISLTDVNLESCTAQEGSGGAVLANDSSTTTVSLTRTVIDTCSAGLNGGGVYLATPTGNTFTDTSISNCTVDGLGGAIFSPPGANVTITGTGAKEDYDHNDADGGGGSIWTEGNASISNINFTNNVAGKDTQTSDLHGGAIFGTSESAIDIHSSFFDDNTAYGSGGAIYAQGPLEIFDGSAFNGNTSDTGGAIFSGYIPTDPSDTAVAIAETTFNSNTSTEGPGGAVRSMDDVTVLASDFTAGSASDTVFDGSAGGGAISAGYAMNPAKVTIMNSVFDLNGSDRGGAVSVSGEISVNNSTFNQNGSTVADPGGLGGALDGTTVNVSTSTFYNNVTSNDGGAIAGATVNVESSSFDQNLSLGTDGGAINATTATVTNSTFDANTAGTNGGAIKIAGGDLAINYSTLTNNSASGQGNAIYRSIATGEFTSIGSVYGSSTDTQQCAEITGSSASTYNATVPTDTSCGFTGGTNITPTWAQMALGPLQPNDGPTSNRLPGAGSWLQAAVPNAIGAADLPSGVDQRGAARANAYWIGAVQGVTPTTPGAPLITGVTGVNNSLSVAFTAPAIDVLPNVVTYQYSTDGGNTWRNRATGTTDSPLVIATTSADNAPLVSETEYPIRIRAVNATGDGSRSNRVNGTPVFQPSDEKPGAVTLAGLRLDSATRVTAAVELGAHTTGLEFRTKKPAGSQWSSWSKASATSALNIPVRVRQGAWIEIRATGPGGHSTTTRAFVRATLPRLGKARGDTTTCQLPRLNSIEYRASRGHLQISPNRSDCLQVRKSAKNTAFGAWQSVAIGKKSIKSAKLKAGTTGQVQFRAGKRTGTVWLYLPTKS